MLPTTRRYVPAFANALDAFDREVGRWVNGLEEGQSPSTTNTASYPVDIHEDDNSFYIDAELPGFTRDQIDISLENSVLTIEAEREAEKREGQQQHVNERRYTRVARTLRVPRSVDSENVDAELSDGVLHITLHKKEEVRPRKINIK